jgi:hypothetical protein
MASPRSSSSIRFGIYGLSIARKSLPATCRIYRNKSTVGQYKAARRRRRFALLVSRTWVHSESIQKLDIVEVYLPYLKVIMRISAC